MFSKALHNYLFRCAVPYFRSKQMQLLRSVEAGSKQDGLEELFLEQGMHRIVPF